MVTDQRSISFLVKYDIGIREVDNGNPSTREVLFICFCHEKYTVRSLRYHGKCMWHVDVLFGLTYSDDRFIKFAVFI